MNANSTREADVTCLADIGIDLIRFSEYLNEYLTPERAWVDYLDSAIYSTETAKKTVYSCVKFCGYQDRADRDGYLEFRDPFSGELIRSIDSFFTFGRACFFFKGQHPFFLICAGAGSKALCLYIPKFDLILDFRAGLAKYLSQELFANLIQILTRRLAANIDAYNSAIAQEYDPAQRTEITVALPQVQNPAHHVWNFFTGLERLVLAGIEGNISSVSFGGSEFFGALSTIFPELGDRIQHGDRQSVIDPHPFSPRHLVLTVGGYFIPKTLTDRIFEKISSIDPRPGNTSPGDNLHFEGKRPVIWFGMRTGDKSWLGQEQGIAEISNRVLRLHPDALFLLDGFSFPVGRDDVTDKWQDAYKRLHDLGERIRSHVSNPEAVLNMVGNTMRESVLWAREVDVYISPVGSTQHKIGWFSDAEGIVYSAPRGAKPLNEERLPGAWESEGSRLPQYVIGKPLEAGERRGKGDRRAHLENMDLDVEALTERVISLIERRLSPP